MIQIWTNDAEMVSDSRIPEHELLKLNITRGLDKGGTAEITLPPGHPAYDRFPIFRTIVAIYRDGALKFRGRALYPQDDFNGRRTITCEGEFCFFQDAMYKSYRFQGKRENVFQRIVQDYNEQVEPLKQFKPGVVSGVGEGTYITIGSEDPATIQEALVHLRDRCGGHFVFSTDETGARVVNWVGTVGTQRQQEITLDNLISLSKNGAFTELVTVVEPLGAKDEETGIRATIESVNNGKSYIKNDAAVTLYGTIKKVVVFDNVAEPSNLLVEAQRYLDEASQPVGSIELTAIDMSYVDKDIDSYDIGDYIKVRSKAHGIYDPLHNGEWFQLTEQSEDLLNPANNKITLGKKTETLTGRSVAVDASTAGAIQQGVAGVKTDMSIAVGQAMEAYKPELRSMISQEVSTLTMMVSSTYVTEEQLASYVPLSSYQSGLVLLADEIRAEVSQTYVTNQQLGNYATTNYVSSALDLLAGSISMDVNGTLGSNASIKLTVNGKATEEVLDLSGVRSAFANDKSAVTINGGKITFNSGTLVINSTNLQVSADGTLTATNAELSGSLTTESGLFVSKLTSGRLRFFYDGTEYGGIASTYYTVDTSKRGIELRTETGASFISFSIYDAEDGAYTPAYIINYGMNPNGRTERHLLYGNARFFNKIWFDSNLAFANNTGVRFTDTDGAETAMFRMDTSNQVLLGNSSYTTSIAGKSIELNNTTNVKADLKCKYNIYLGNSYCLRTYTKDGSVGVQAVWMSDSNYLYIGDTSYPTYVQGSTTHIGRTDANTRIYGAWIYLSSRTYCNNVPIVFSNGYGIQLRNTDGTDHYALTMNSSNNVQVGAANHQLRLRGSSVVLNSSGAAVSSDRRLKNSIEDLGDAYEVVLDRLRPVRFKYNDGTSGRYHAGFIAQEVQEALAAAGLTTQDFGGFVDLNGDGEELGLIYTEFIALLLQKIKRLERRVAALDAVQ